MPMDESIEYFDSVKESKLTKEQERHLDLS